MPRCLIFSVLFLTCAGTLLSQDPDDERPGFSRPRRASGTQVVRAQEGSHPFDGDWPALAAVPLERSHYRWSAEYLDAARREAYVDADIGEGHRLGARQAAAGPLSKAPPRGLTFDGLNRLTSAYLGIVAYPPDPNLAVSKTAIIQATNIAVRLTNRQGVEIDRQPLNNFLGFNSNSVLFDPKVYFDRLSGRFYVVALEQSESPRRSGIWIAVSKNGNPSALRAPQDFCTYRISGNRGGSWADYPTIGINEDWFAIGVNNFRFGDGGFRRAHVYVMAVDRITDNAQSCPTLGVKRFNVRQNPDGERVFGIHPAQHYNKNNFPGTPLFMVSAAFLLPSAQYTLWQITTGTAGAPMLSSQILTGDFSYSFAPAAPQRGGSDLDPGDPRITQVAFRKGKIWAVHGVGCAIGTLPNEACLRPFAITPSAAGPASITYSETFGREDLFLFWPGIAVNKLGDVLVVSMRAKEGAFVRTVYSGKRPAEASFVGLRNLGNGTCTLDNPAGGDEGINRTGDYVGVQADPKDNLSFWLTGELTGNLGSGFGCDWKTKIARTKY